MQASEAKVQALSDPLAKSFDLPLDHRIANTYYDTFDTLAPRPSSTQRQRCKGASDPTLPARRGRVHASSSILSILLRALRCSLCRCGTVVGCMELPRKSHTVSFRTFGGRRGWIKPVSTGVFYREMDPGSFGG